MPIKKAVKSPNTKTAKKKAPKFEIVLELHGETLREKTDDVVKTFMEMKPDYFVKTKVILTVKSDKKEVQRVLMPSKIKRMFNNRVASALYFKSILTVFNG